MSTKSLTGEFLNGHGRRSIPTNDFSVRSGIWSPSSSLPTGRGSVSPEDQNEMRRLQEKYAIWKYIFLYGVLLVCVFLIQEIFKG